MGPEMPVAVLLHPVVYRRDPELCLCPASCRLKGLLRREPAVRGYSYFSHWRLASMTVIARKLAGILDRSVCDERGHVGAVTGGATRRCQLS